MRIEKKYTQSTFQFQITADLGSVGFLYAILFVDQFVAFVASAWFQRNVFHLIDPREI